MTRILPPLLAALLSTASALAEEAASPAGSVKPQPLHSQLYSGVKLVPYSAIRRQDVVGMVGEPTTITFPAEESITHVWQSKRIGDDGRLVDDSPWQAAPQAQGQAPEALANLLTLWPARAGSSSMTVSTCIPSTEAAKCKYGTQKPYLFRLIAIDGSGSSASDVTQNLIYKGGTRAISPTASAALMTIAGDDAPAKPKRLSKRQRQRESDEAAVERIRTDSFNAAGGCHYTARGVTPNPISPRCPLDNGIWTIVRFPGLTSKPAVYISDPAYLCGADEGAHERLARQHAQGDFIVVEEIAKRFCLRLNGVLQLDNDAFNPAGAPTGTGTIAPPPVHRDLIKASR